MIRLKETEKSKLFYCILFTFITGLIAHAFGFFSDSFSHDGLTVFFADEGEELVKLRLGRFIVPVYRFLTRGAVTLPWLTGLLGIAWISLAVYLTVKIFGFERKSEMLLTAGIMTANICVTALSATYRFEFDVDMFAMLLAILAAYMWSGEMKVWRLALGSLFVALSIAVYQSYLSVTVTVLMLASVIAIAKGDGFKKAFIKGLSGIGMILFGGILYYVLYYWLICPVFNITPYERTDFPSLLGGNIGALIGETYVFFFKELMSSAFLRMINAIAALTSLIGTVVLMIKNKVKKVSDIILLFLLALLLPFGTASIYFLSSGEVHDLMIFSFNFLYVAAISLASLARDACSKEKTDDGKEEASLYVPLFAYGKLSLLEILSGALKAVAFLTVGILIWQNSVFANKVYLKKSMDERATLSLMTRIVTRIEDAEGYIPGETPVAFVGSYSFDTYKPGFEEVGKVTGFSKHIDVTYYLTYHPYFNYMLNYPITILGEGEAIALGSDERVLAMPSYPAQGSVENIDGTVVVKLS